MKFNKLSKGKIMDLLQFKKDVHSQFGEDGILEKIFEVLSISKGWCVEFGAWDGVQMSNTCNLIKNKNWSAVLIEGSAKKFPDLKSNYALRKDVFALNRMVGFDSPHLLDNILSTTPIPLDFELLSIDIDGNDYHIFDSVNTYHPKVVVIEFNPSFPNQIEFFQNKDSAVNHGSSLNSITKLAKQKGYELICVTDVNGIYIDKSLYPLFEIKDNSLDELHKNRSWETYLIQLFDGTLIAAGQTRMIWHGIQIDNDRLQMLPREYRRFNDD